MKKFGAILGDYVEIGCNSVLNPGTVVGRGASVAGKWLPRSACGSEKGGAGAERPPRPAVF